MKLSKVKKNLLAQSTVLLILVLTLLAGFGLTQFALDESDLNSSVRNMSEVCDNPNYDCEQKICRPDYSEHVCEPNQSDPFSGQTMNERIDCMEKYDSAANLSDCVNNITK